MTTLLAITPWFIYWFTRLDHILMFLSGLSYIGIAIVIVSLIVSVVTFIIVQSFTCNSNETNIEDEKVVLHVNKISKNTLIIAFIVTTLINITTAFIPNTKEMAAIYVVPKILNNEKVQNVGAEFIELAIAWLKELQPSNIKSKEESK